MNIYYICEVPYVRVCVYNIKYINIYKTSAPIKAMLSFIESILFIWNIIPLAFFLLS